MSYKYNINDTTLSKDIIFTFGTFAHSSMVHNFFRYELEDPMHQLETIFPIGHALISISILLRANSYLRKNYYQEMAILGTLGHSTLTMASLSIGYRELMKGENHFDINELMFLAGQVSMAIMYYNKYKHNKGRVVFMQKLMALTLLMLFYIKNATNKNNAKLVTPMITIAVLYIMLLMSTAYDGIH
jgi:hypothetical protein